MRVFAFAAVLAASCAPASAPHIVNTAVVAPQPQHPEIAARPVARVSAAELRMEAAALEAEASDFAVSSASDKASVGRLTVLERAMRTAVGRLTRGRPSDLAAAALAVRDVRDFLRGNPQNP